MKLDKLKDYIPKVDDKSNEIYQEANKKNNRFRFVFSIKIVSLATLCLIVLIGIILLPKWRNNTIEENVEVDYTDETVMLKSAALNLDFTKYNVCKEYEINPEVDIFLEKLEDFSHKISVEIYDGTDENYLVSPVSIYMALAMVIECTNGETREEVLNAVGVTYDEVINFTKYIYGLANRKYYDKNNKLSAFEELANSIWIEESIDLKKACLDILSEYYHVDSLHVPFKNNPVYANDLLKKYVHDKTYGLINLELEIPPSTLFLLVNTYYIKDNWLYNGSELNFTDRIYDFKNVDGSITSTKLLMGEYTPGQIYESDKFYHFTQKSYKGYKMKIILPKDDYTVDDIYNYEILKEVNNVTDYKPVDDKYSMNHFTRVLFPEFEVSAKKIINSDLKKIGIHKIFDEMNADFSNITDINSYVGMIYHETKLKVDSRGFEGAAVTIVQQTTSSGPMFYENVYHELVLDRPFAFILTNQKDVVLFSGIVKII